MTSLHSRNIRICRISSQYSYFEPVSSHRNWTGSRWSLLLNWWVLYLSRRQYSDLWPLSNWSPARCRFYPAVPRSFFAFNHIFELNPSQCSSSENTIQILTHWVLSHSSQWPQMFPDRWTVCCLYHAFSKEKTLSPWDSVFKPQLLKSYHVFSHASQHKIHLTRLLFGWLLNKQSKQLGKLSCTVPSQYELWGFTPRPLHLWHCICGSFPFPFGLPWMDTRLFALTN